MTKVGKFTFGCIEVDGKKYRKDILIFADGSVKGRKGGFLMFGSHEIKRREIEELSRGQPELIMVGTGTDGAARVTPEAERWAKERNLGLLVQPSYDAVAKLNELVGKKKVAALIHVTC